MGREKHNFKRPSAKKKPYKLFVIATEGEKTEIKYFQALVADERFEKKPIYIELIPSSEGKSNPERILKNLDEFKNKYNLFDEDELWLLIDRDKQSWKEREISGVAQKCSQKKYNLALSNPCFEIWFLLHLQDISILGEEIKKELFENKKDNNRSKVELLIIEKVGNYNKQNPNIKIFIPLTETAISNAEKLIQDEAQRWPTNVGTYVYKLVKKLLVEQ